MGTGRRPGRPRKKPLGESVAKVVEKINQAKPIIEGGEKYAVRFNDPAQLAQLKEAFVETENHPPLTEKEARDSWGGDAVESQSQLKFTEAEVQRIKSADEIYLVTKRNERIDGLKDKQIHMCMWLKEVL